MSYPTKAIREACWRERDNLWKCLDDNNDNESKCAEIRKAMIGACPDQWVSHYDRRRQYLKFTEKMKQGYDPIDDFSKLEEQAGGKK